MKRKSFFSCEVALSGIKLLFIPLSIIRTEQRVGRKSQRKVVIFQIIPPTQPCPRVSIPSFQAHVLVFFFLFSPSLHYWLPFLYIIQKNFKNYLKKVKGVVKSCSFHGMLAVLKIGVCFKIQRTLITRFFHHWENNCCSHLFCHCILPVAEPNTRRPVVVLRSFACLNGDEPFAV